MFYNADAVSMVFMNTTCEHTNTTVIDVPALGWGQTAQQVTLCNSCLAEVVVAR